nr:tRNA (N6-isopentenyl adenosine(37)-C2)-methylthiotransferase MiaB [uncultured Porphyromonas sp.]
MQKTKYLYLETYGCQMNVADSEVIRAVTQTIGYETTEEIDQADAIFLNTCSVRENAEQKIYTRLSQLRALREKLARPIVIGVLGCMAENVREALITEHHADLVAGPDSYQDLPNLVSAAEAGEPAVNVTLSRSETYADIVPVKLPGVHISGYISIMRGCDQFCTYCIVPYTRGRERSREVKSILAELDQMREMGYREVVLLGQTVDAYSYTDESGVTTDFPRLLALVAERAPEMRIRFTSPNPMDMTDETLHTMAAHPNICRHIHLPLQSGSDVVLKRMRRGYDVAQYKSRVEAIHRILPDCAITTDMITGFCGETEKDFRETLELMEWVPFDSAYMFYYSERPGTYAAKYLDDDVPEEVKIDRLSRMIDLQRRLSEESNRRQIGQEVEVLVEGFSKRSRAQLSGRTSQDKVVVFDKKEDVHFGDTVRCHIDDVTSATLLGHLV